MREFWREFCRDRRGNYALMTVLAMVPLMGGVAMAVDYTGSGQREADGGERARRRQLCHRAPAGRRRHRRPAEGLCARLLQGQSQQCRSRQHDARRHAADQHHRRRHPEALRCPGVSSLFPAGGGDADRQVLRYDRLLRVLGSPAEEHAGSRHGAGQFRLHDARRAPAPGRSASTCSSRRPSSWSTRWPCRPR